MAPVVFKDEIQFPDGLEISVSTISFPRNETGIFRESPPKGNIDIIPHPEGIKLQQAHLQIVALIESMQNISQLSEVATDASHKLLMPKDKS